MRRSFALASLLVLSLAGCLRTRVDLCAQVPPHPECAYLDAGRDAPGSDAPDATGDAPMTDATDAGVDASDAD